MSNRSISSIIVPDWPAPKNIRAFSSTRLGGVSSMPYCSLNLGAHVGDQPDSVNSNRRRFFAATEMPDSIRWLNQVHGTNVVDLPTNELGDITADAAFSLVQHQVCAVMTADCLPLLLCNKQGTEVAACHAGWRGLCDGVIERTVSRFSDPADVLVWLGPAIGARKFEVGGEVRNAFIAKSVRNVEAFVPVHTQESKWLGDLYSLARLCLQQLGVKQVFGGDFCTYEDHERFFSYRRDNKTGRMASAIWLDNTN